MAMSPFVLGELCHLTHRPGKVRLQWDEAVEGHPVHVFSGLFDWASSRQLPAAIVGSHPSVSKSWAVGH